MLKASDKPQISKKWWTNEKPDDIKGQDLEKALAAAEKAIGEADKRKDADSVEAGLKSLNALDSAVDKTIKKECDKKKHKDLITVLDKFSGLIKSEVGRLDGLKKKAGKAEAESDGEAGGDEDEEDEGKLFDPEYLQKMIKLLRGSSKEFNFGFGMNTNDPAGCKLLLARKGKPEKLMKALKQAGFTQRLITYGTASRSGRRQDPGLQAGRQRRRAAADSEDWPQVPARRQEPEVS